MKHTVSLKLNHEFQRLYRRGRSAVSPHLALYYRETKREKSRLGLTVGTKVGKAVTRNKIRRRLREAYRIHEHRFRPGIDLVVVARVRSAHASYQEIERSLLRTADKLGILLPEAQG